MCGIGKALAWERRCDYCDISAKDVPHIAAYCIYGTYFKTLCKRRAEPTYKYFHSECVKMYFSSLTEQEKLTLTMRVRFLMDRKGEIKFSLRRPK